jgi:NAD+ synthase
MAHFKAKHRMRMVLVYFYGESNNLLIVGAAHLSEDMTGLFSKFGIDNNADIMPLGNLYRTQILQLAKYLGVPERILNKPSSPDLIPGVEDKYIYLIGLPSEKVDLILFGLEKGMGPEDISKQIGVSPSKVNYIKELTKRSFHMRHPSIMPDLLNI